jgi:hypothetical protein
VLNDGLAGDFEEGLFGASWSDGLLIRTRDRFNSPWAHPETADGNEYLC